MYQSQKIYSLLPMENLYCSSGIEFRGSAHSLHLCVFYANGKAVYLFSSVIFRVLENLFSFTQRKLSMMDEAVRPCC